jgi:hypothetical protein
MPYNLTDYRPLMRGALVALDRWVKTVRPPRPAATRASPMGRWYPR